MTSPRFTDLYGSLSGTINVKQFGAKGDGTTDDTVAIQAAISSVEGGTGGILLFPGGTYVVTSDLTLISNNVTILGVGVGFSSSATAFQIANNNLFTLSGPHLSNYSFQNFAVYTSNTTGSGHFLNFVNANVSSLSVSKVRSLTLNSALNITANCSIFGGSVRECQFDGCRSPTFYYADGAYVTLMEYSSVKCNGTYYGRGHFQAIANTTAIGEHTFLNCDFEYSSGLYTIDFGKLFSPVTMIGCRFLVNQMPPSEGANSGQTANNGADINVNTGLTLIGCDFSAPQSSANNFYYIRNANTVLAMGCRFDSQAWVSGSFSNASPVLNIMNNNLSVGGNAVVNSTGLAIATANSTANGFLANSSTLSVGNSTVNAIITGGTFTLGGGVSTNNPGLYVSSSFLGFGNNSVNAVVNSSTITIGVANSSANGLLANCCAVVLGNSSVNATINATTFSGTSLSANNATNLGGVAAASYVNTSAAFVSTGSLTWGNSTVNAFVNSTAIDLGNSTVGIIANSSAFSVGSVNATTVGTILANNLFTIGNSSVNATINSTTFSGTSLTANNATNLGGTAAAGYQTTAGLASNVATMTANALVGGRTLEMYRIYAPAAANIAVGTYPILWTQNAITISEVVIVLQNTAATAWASSGLYWGSTLGTQQNVVFAAANNANITTGVHTTSFTNATMAANTWLWANVSTVSNVTTLTIAVRY